MLTLNEAVNMHADDLARELCRLDNAACEMYETLRQRDLNSPAPTMAEARMEVMMREVAEMRLRVIRLERQIRGRE